MPRCIDCVGNQSMFDETYITENIVCIFGLPKRSVTSANVAEFLNYELEVLSIT